MQESKIFLGNTPSATRAFLLSAFGELSKKYNRLVVPCCGQMAIPLTALKAGWKPEQIFASDVSLFTTVLGYYITGKPLKDLNIEIGGEPWTKPKGYAEVLYWLKYYASLAQSRHYFQAVAVKELREQDLNARVMPDAMFRRLTETIERDERLEALPFCAVSDKGIEIVSGHHRIRAARSAGMKETWAIVDVSGLSQSQIKAKQLAHNAISGRDDPSMLEQIYAQLSTIEDMREAFIFEGDFDKLAKVGEGVGIAEIEVDFDIKTVFLLFLPTYYEKWKELLKRIPPDTDDIALADAKIAEQFREALKAVGKSYDIKAATPLLCKMIDHALGDKESGDDWVYLADIFGARIPKASLEVVEKAIEKALKAKDVKKSNVWQLIEYWAADYLGGGG